MEKFTWKGIQFSVSEMNRAVALTCSSTFQALFAASGGELPLTEVEEHVACYAPVVIQNGSGAFTGGEHSVTTDDGETLMLTLPMTREQFQALPMSLTTAWCKAAMGANPWLTVDLKNAESRTTTPTSEPPSGKTPL